MLISEGMRANVCVVTVTYGERFSLLAEVVYEILEQGVSRIIIVDNNSNDLSRQKLQDLQDRNKNIINIIQLPENTGPDNGFRVGLQAAHSCNDTDFIWLLDDDNRPKQNALKELLDFWDRLDIQEKKNSCLASLRESFTTFKKAVMTTNPELPVGPRNSYRNFHILDLYRKIYNRIFQHENSKISNKAYGELLVAPYGGMFFPRDLLSTIGYPDNKFFIYCGDFEFSHRIVKQGGKIFLILNSVIEDLDKSWHTRKSGPDFLKLAGMDANFRLYYDVRNRVFFELNQLVNDRMIYSLNMLIYSILFVFSVLALLNFSKIPVYIEAILDGLRGKLGKNENFVI